MNCIEPHDQRTRRPSVNWFPLRATDLQFKAQTYARAQAVTGTRAVLHDAKILASLFFATQARYCCGLRNFVEGAVCFSRRANIKFYN